MAIDIVKSSLRYMAAEGIKIDEGLLNTLLSAYMRHAEGAVRFCAGDGVFNGLRYPNHDEETEVATFGRSIRAAAKDCKEDSLSSSLFSNWNRVQSALPSFLGELHEAVQLDNSE